MGEVSHRLALPFSVASVHLVFYVLMQWCYIPERPHVIPLDLVEMGKNLTYEKEPVASLERLVRMLRTKEIALVMVQWWHQPMGEATCNLLTSSF